MYRSKDMGLERDKGLKWPMPRLLPILLSVAVTWYSSDER